MSHSPLDLKIWINQNFNFPHFVVFLQGKAKKEKPCTRPLPFSRTHSKTLKKAAENEQPISVLQSKIGIHSVQQNNAAGSITQKQSNSHANPSKNLHVLWSDVDLTKSGERSKESITESTSQLKGQHGPVSTFKPPAHLSHLSTVRKNTLHQNSPAYSAEACIYNMNQLSIKDLTKTSHAQQSVQLTEQAKSSTGQSENGYFAITSEINALMLYPLNYNIFTFYCYFFLLYTHSVMLSIP